MKYFISSSIWICFSGLAGIACAESFGDIGIIMIYAAGCFGIAGAFTHSLFVYKKNYNINSRYSWVVIGLITLLVSILFLSIIFISWSGLSADIIEELWFFTKLLFIPALVVSLLGEWLIKETSKA